MVDLQREMHRYLVEQVSDEVDDYAQILISSTRSDVVTRSLLRAVELDTRSVTGNSLHNLRSLLLMRTGVLQV